MANIVLKSTGLLVVDPGADPAAPGLHGQVSSGGFLESAGKTVSTQASGWRALLVSRGGAT